MAFPSTSLIDNFTGPDGSIDGRTALNGDTWNVGDGTVAITSNQIGSSFGGATLNGPYGPNVEAYITVISPPTVDDDYIQLGVRDTGTAKYALLLYNYTGSKLRLAITNPFTWINWYDVNVVAGDKIGLQAIGNKLGVWHDAGTGWTLIAEETDGTLTAAGTINFVRDPTLGSTILLDDFGGGTIAYDRQYKRLYGPAQLGASPTTLYTVPVAIRAEVRSIHVSNPSGTSVDLNLSIGTDAAGTRIYDDYPLPSKTVDNSQDRHSLAAGETIQGWAGTAGTIVVTINGWEEPA